MGLTQETLFVGATRPSMRWGVTYVALMFNLMLTMELFLITRNLLALLVCLPVHGVCALLCTHDARFFELLLLWGRTRLPALFANQRYWGCCSFSPLLVDPANTDGRRRCRQATPLLWCKAGQR